MEKAGKTVEFEVKVLGRVITLVAFSDGTVQLAETCQVSPDHALEGLAWIIGPLSQFLHQNRDRLEQINPKKWRVVDPERESHRGK